MKGKWGIEPEWMHDMRQLENTVRDALAARGFTAARSEGREGSDHVVQTGFDTFIPGPEYVAVVWRAAYNHVMTPNETRERRLAMYEALTSVDLKADLSPGSSEVRVSPK